MPIGDSQSTPFTYFASGSPVFPPNTLIQDAEQVLALLDADTAQQKIESLVRWGNVGGVRGVLPECTWYAFIRDFLFREQEIIDPSFRQSIFKTVAMRPPLQSWEPLKDFLIKEIDWASGWNRSYHREDPRLKKVQRHEDGTYSFTDDDGRVIRIHGAETLPETRLQFIADEILRSYGRIRRVLNFYCMFAIAADFAQSPSSYPKSLRLIAWSSEWGTAVPPTWHLGQFFKTRTIHWHPNNNLCDPDWLAGDLLGRITDSIDRDIWAEISTAFQQRPDPLEQDYPFQWDFALETDLVIGDGPEACLEFEGRKFRWINHTPESQTLLSVRSKGPKNEEEDVELINRFLSALVWKNGTSIRKNFGVGGAKRLTPIASGVCIHGGMQVAPEHALPTEPMRAKQKVLALALYKEAKGANSVFNKFLNYYKILELAFPRWRDAEAWICKTVPVLIQGKEWLAQVPGNPAEYLRDSCRHAVAHAQRKPILNPDSFHDNRRLEQDERIMGYLAAQLIRSGVFD